MRCTASAAVDASPTILAHDRQASVFQQPAQTLADNFMVIDEEDRDWLIHGFSLPLKQPESGGTKATNCWDAMNRSPHGLT
jgi:hypothetical protein